MTEIFARNLDQGVCFEETACLWEMRISINIPCGRGKNIPLLQHYKIPPMQNYLGCFMSPLCALLLLPKNSKLLLVCPSVRIHQCFSYYRGFREILLETYMKMFRKNPNLFIFGQNSRSLFIKNWVLLLLSTSLIAINSIFKGKCYQVFKLAEDVYVSLEHVINLRKTYFVWLDVFKWPGVEIITLYICHHNFSWFSGILVTRPRDSGWFSIVEEQHWRNEANPYSTEHKAVSVANLPNCCIQEVIIMVVMPNRRSTCLVRTVTNCLSCSKHWYRSFHLISCFATDIAH